MESLKRALKKLDDAVFRVERLVLLFSLAMMTLLVSLDVVQRTFSRPEGKTEQVLRALLYGKSPTPEQTAFVTGRLGPGVFWGLALIFLVLAAHSSRTIASERAQKPAPGLGRSVAWGAGLWVGALGFVYGLLWLFPSSVPGAQKFSLGFMLWSGMLGASLATRSRRHIVLDVVKKKLDPETASPSRSWEASSPSSSAGCWRRWAPCSSGRSSPSGARARAWACMTRCPFRCGSPPWRSR